MKQRPASVSRRFAACRQGELVISAITLAELEYGVHCSSVASHKQNRRALDTLLTLVPAVPFNQSAAHAYVTVKAAVPERKQDALDKLIASHAKSLNLILVTNNMSDFQHYPGIKLENWVAK